MYVVHSRSFIFHSTVRFWNRESENKTKLSKTNEQETSKKQEHCNAFVKRQRYIQTLAELWQSKIRNSVRWWTYICITVYDATLSRKKSFLLIWTPSIALWSNVLCLKTMICGPRKMWGGRLEEYFDKFGCYDTVLKHLFDPHRFHSRNEWYRNSLHLT